MKIVATELSMEAREETMAAASAATTKPLKPGITKISCLESVKLSHKWRSEIDGIMVGTNTIICDNPQLSNRYSEG